jgi:hypothetical protein
MTHCFVVLRDTILSKGRVEKRGKSPDPELILVTAKHRQLGRTRSSARSSQFLRRC